MDDPHAHASEVEPHPSGEGRYALHPEAERLALEELARLAAATCGTPLGAACGTVGGRARVLAASGFDPAEIPEESHAAICSAALGGGDLFLVEDAAADPRFRDNPLVRGGPRVRFFAAGRVPGERGEQDAIVAVMAPYPLRLEPGRREALRALARHAASHLALLRSLRALAEEHLDARGSSAASASALEDRWMGELLEAVADAVVVVDRRGRIVFATGEARRMFGYEAGDLAGRSIDALVPESMKAGHRAHRRRFMERPERRPMGLELDLRGRRRDGSTFPVDVALSPLERAGEVAVVCTIRDLTERQAVQRSLDEAQRLEAIGRLAAGIAHDFNNHLQVILFEAEIIRADSNLSDASLRELDELVGAAERSASLTGELLAFSRRQVMRPSVVDANDVVRRIGSVLSRLLGEDVRVERVLGAEIPPVHVDRSRLERVIMNLAVNARDAMPGGGTLTLSTRFVPGDGALDSGAARNDAPRGGSSDAASGRVEIAVRDTGTGMDAATLDRIFEPFYTTKERGRGTGLGLSSAYGTVEQAGGSMRVESTPGEGSTFFVYLPALGADVRPTCDERPPRPRRPTAAGGGAILLIEDDPAVRRALSAVLRGDGHEVVEAADGHEAEAVAEAAGDAIAVLVCDVTLPGSDGPEVARRLRSRRPDLPVVFMSGYPEGVHSLRELHDAGVEWLPKPFEAATLLATVRAALGTE